MGVSSKGSVTELTCTPCFLSRALKTMESSRLRANREYFHTNIRSKGLLGRLASATILWNWGLSAVRPLSASSTNSLTTVCPFLAAYSLSARSCAAMDRSVSCFSDDTRAYSAAFMSTSVYVLTDREP